MDSTSSIERRLATAERKLRWCMLIIGVMACGTILAVTMAAAEAPVQGPIITTSLKVVNDDGKVVVELSGDKHGGAVTVFDPTQTSFAAMAVAPDPGLVMCVKNDKPVVALNVKEDGGQLLMANRDGEQVWEANASAGGGNLVIHTPDGGREIDLLAIRAAANIRVTQDGKQLFSTPLPDSPATMPAPQ